MWRFGGREISDPVDERAQRLLGEIAGTDVERIDGVKAPQAIRAKPEFS